MANSDIEISSLFVGREPELELLKQTLQQCIAERRLRVALISGDIGVGKTWLVERFLADATVRHTGILIGRGRCALETDQNGLVPFAQILGALAQRTMRGRVSASGVSDFILKVAPAWLDVITHGMASATAKTVEEGQKAVRYSRFSQENVFVQYSQALARIAHSHPTICFIDDLQWADASSLSLLFHLTRNLASCPLMIVCTVRTGEITADESRSELLAKIQSNLSLYGALEIELTQGIDAAEYIAQRYPSNLIPHPFIRRVQEITQGHPLFLSTLFSEWERPPAAITYVSRPDGTKVYSIEDASLMRLEIPRTLGNAVAERLAHLDDDTRKVLERAAIEGNTFTAQVVACVSELSEMKTFEILDLLQHQRQIVVSSPQEQDEALSLDSYQFIHRFYREFIYNGIGPGRRKAFHRSVGECLERICPHQPAVAAQLAFHFGQAGEHLRQAFCSLQAARFEQVRWAWSEGEHWCSVGLAALERVKPVTTETESLRIELLMYSGQGICFRGDCINSEKRYQEALALARRTDADCSVLAEIYSELAYLCDVTGRIEESLAYARKGLEILKEPEGSDVFLYVKLQLDYAGALSRQGFDKKALSVYDNLLAMTGETETTLQIEKLLPVAHNRRGITLGNLGRFREAETAYREAIELATRLGDTRFCGICWLNLAYDSLQQNQAEEAETFIELGEPLSRLAGDLDTLAYARALRGSVLLSKGDARSAEHEMLSAITESENLGSNWNMVDMYADLALVRLALGRLNDARQDAIHALSIGESSGDPLDIGAACIVLGRVETALGHFEEAEQVLRRAYTLHSQANHPHLTARAQGFLGESLLQAGRFVEAMQELRQAIQGFKELGLNGNAELFQHLLNQGASDEQ